MENLSKLAEEVLKRIHSNPSIEDHGFSWILIPGPIGKKDEDLDMLFYRKITFPNRLKRTKFTEVMGMNENTRGRESTGQTLEAIDELCRAKRLRLFTEHQLLRQTEPPITVKIYLLDGNIIKQKEKACRGEAETTTVITFDSPEI